MKKVLTLALLAIVMAMAQMTGQSPSSAAQKSELTIGRMEVTAAPNPGGVVSDIVLTSNVVKNFAEKDAAKTMKDADVPLPPLLANINVSNTGKNGKGLNVKDFKKESASRCCNTSDYS